MSMPKVLTGVCVVLLLSAVIYLYRRGAELENHLVAVRTENESAGRQLRNLEREIAAIKSRPNVAERRSTGTGGVADSLPIPAAPPAPPAPPPPGVTPKAPQGWHKNGSANDLYEVGVDENNSWGGMPSAYAQSTGEANGKFGGMMQSISASAYANQRVRLNGWMKTEDANDGGGHLWLRVDGKEYGRSLSFDNMDGRAPKGTTDWQEYSIVLDVPEDATKVNYGFFMQGKGKMWVNGLTINPVGTDVPTTNIMRQAPELSKAPVNLGFGPGKG